MRESARFTFRVTTPAVTAVSSPDGTTEVILEGFGTRERRPGAPDLPSKTVLVAIPDGVVPRLDVRVLDEGTLGLRPRPVARLLHDVDPEDPSPARAPHERSQAARVRTRELREADEALFEEAAAQPPARLGTVGVLRHQRYVEVILSPLRPAGRGLAVARRYEVTVSFDGAPAPAAPSAAPDPFEDVYRDAFVNYDQGTTFRLQAAGATTRASTLEAPLSGPRYRIRTRANGPVRLDHTRMTGTGFLAEPLSTWRLSSRGVEVPLRVKDDGDDLMEPGEWVEFYGQALDDEPETSLNTLVPGGTNVYEARDFSDENVAFLTVEAGPRSRMPTRDGTPNALTPPATFEAVARREVDDAWRPLGAADPWGMTPTLSSNGTTTVTDDVPLPGLAAGTEPAQVRVRLRGTSENAAIASDHRSRVTFLNASSQTLATQDDDGSFDGREDYDHVLDWAYAGTPLTSPAKVRVEARPISSGSHSMVRDFVEIRYRRTFAASGDVLTFDWPDGNAAFQVTGLASSAPEVWEVTGRVGGTGIADAVRHAGVQVAGAGPYTASFRMDEDPALADGTPRRFVVFGSGAVAVPAGTDFEADTVSDLRSTSIQADLVVIGPASLLDTSAGSALTLLLNRRASQGYTSKVARLADVEDEFNHGLSGPTAIESFLRWITSTAAGEGWADPKPAYVLLIGDGSYDYKGGTAQGNHTPTWILFKDDPALGYLASDNRMAAVLGTDHLADLTIGRIPCRTVTEANALLQKILDYDQAAPAGTWRKHSLFVSDRGKGATQGDIEQQSLEFEAVNDVAAGYLKAPPHTLRKLRYWTDYGGSNPNGIKSDIKKAVNGTLDAGVDGAAMMQFIGHGNFDLWSDDVIFCGDETNAFCSKDDTTDLNNGLRLPWLLVHNCLSAGFHTTDLKTLGESWFKRSGGGAMAVFAPTSLSFPYFGEEVSKVVWNDLHGPRKERLLGTAVQDSWVRLCGQGSDEACQSYALLGDPLSPIHLPTVKPATNPAAAAGNAQATVSWTASTTAGAVYDVYRSTSATGTYARVKAAHPASPYVDTGLTNGTVTYYYYVVAVDPSGFESRWSNFNSDCAVGGPDCVKARPLNPNPPAAPTGVAVVDPETGGKLNVSWTANAEADLSFYTVHYGTAPGAYTDHVGVQKNTSASLQGLTNGVTYYIAVTATNTSDKTSSYSQEKTGVPTFVRGVRSPGFVETLRVDRSGTDALLTWTAVTTDIYGKAETVSKYEIFRGTTPTFVPGAANKAGESTSASFTDAGALQLANPNYHWLVRAVDAEGNVGGLGNQLPNGIDALTVSKSAVTPGNLVISWPAVTTDFDGRPLAIDHYEVYARGTPFSRADIRNGLVPKLQNVGGTSVEITPPAGSQYYSVLAVDARGNVSPF